MALGVTLNNPGNLTVSGPNSIVYDGQTGVYSANGLFYAVFSNAQAGAQALLTWLSNNVGSNDATSLTTPSELTSYYLNGSYGPLTNTASNPNANSYLSSLEQSTGLGPNGQLSSVPLTTIAAGIQRAEGNGALGNLFGSSPTNSSSTLGGSAVSGIESGISNLETWGQSNLQSFITGSQFLASNGVVASAAVLAAPNTVAGTKAAVANPTGSLLAPLISFFQGLNSEFINWENKTFPNAVERIAFGLVALVLLLAGIWFLANNAKQNLNIVTSIAKKGLPVAALA